jgi:hypothetical protein
MGKLLDRMVRRAVPPNLADAEQERIAAEAAENALRSVAWLTIVPSLLLLAVLALLARRDVPALQASPPPSTASQTARVLSSENAELRLGAEALQKRLDELTREREELYNRVADLQKRTTDVPASQASPSPAGAPPAGAGAPPPQQPVAQPAPPKPTEPPAAEHPTPKPTPHGPAPTRVAAAPRSAPAPAAASAPPMAPAAASLPSYLCRDGRTVHQASDCEAAPPAPTGAPGPRQPSSLQQLASLPPAAPRPQFVVEFRQEVAAGPALPGQSVVVNFYDAQRNVINSSGWVTNGTGRTPVFTAPGGTAYFQVVGPDDVPYAWPGNGGHVLEVNPTGIDPAQGLVVIRFLTR